MGKKKELKCDICEEQIKIVDNPRTGSTNGIVEATKEDCKRKIIWCKFCQDVYGKCCNCQKKYYPHTYPNELKRCENCRGEFCPNCWGTDEYKDYVFLRDGLCKECLEAEAKSDVKLAK
jgi:hypothetical protein